MATNRDIVFVLKLRNEARAGLRQIADDLRRLRGAGGGGGRGGPGGPGPNPPGGRPNPPPGGSPDPRPIQQTTSAYRGLARAAQAAAAAFSIVQLTQMADRYTILTNRVRLVTRNEAELVTVRRELVSLANANRQGLEATAELYSRIARNAENLGLSQQNVLDLTQSVSQALVISATGTQAAEAALIQFGQALASDRLSGDELRSILENAPRLAQAIADGMGVTVGQLRKLGADGALSAKVVVDAIRTQSAALASEFSKMEITAGQGFTILQNGLLVVVGSFNEASKAAGGLGRLFSRIGMVLADPATVQAVADFGNAVADVFNGILDVLSSVVQRVATAVSALEQTLSDNIFAGFTVGLTDVQTMVQRLATYLATFAAFMATNYVRGLVAAAIATGGLSSALLVLRGALIRTGIGAIVVLVGELIFQLSKMAEKVGGVGTLMELFGDVAREVWQRLGFLIDGIAAKTKSWGEYLKANVADGVLGALESVVDFGNNAVNTFEGAFEAIKVIWGMLPSAIGDLMIQAANNLINGLEDMIKRAASGLDGFIEKINGWLETAGSDRRIGKIGELDLFGEIPNQFAGAAQEAAAAASTAFNSAFEDNPFTLPDSVSSYLADTANEARRAGNEFMIMGQNMMAATTGPLISVAALRTALLAAADGSEEAEAALVDLNDRLGNGGTSSSTEGAAKAASEAMKLLQKAIEEQTPRTTKLQQEHDALRAALVLMRGSLTPEQIDLVTQALQRQADILGGGAAGGIREGARSYLDGLKSMSEEIADFTTNQFQALETTLTDFFLTGKMGFKEFADTAIKELMRILVRQWIIAPIAGFVQGLMPGVSHVGSLPGEAARSVRRLPRYHTGGIGSGEEMAVIRRNEAVLPTARLSDGTLGIRAQGMGSGSTIVNNVTVNVDGGASGGSAQQQEAFAQSIGRQVQAALEQEMGRFTQREMRPGGMLYSGGR